MSEKLSIEIAEHAAQLTASGQERQHDLYTGWAQWARGMETDLKAMERALDEISELSHGQGIAAIYIAAKALGKKLPDTGSLAAI